MAAEGAGDEAVRLLESVIDRYRRLCLPLELVRSLVTLAEVNRRSRRRAAAQKLLAEARELAGAAEARARLDRVDAEVQRLDGGPGPPGGGGPTAPQTPAVLRSVSGRTSQY